MEETSQNKETEMSAAYQEGQRAACECLYSYENPYQVWQSEYMDWHSGYKSVAEND